MLTLHPDKCTNMEIRKIIFAENQYYTTMNNVTKTVTGRVGSFTTSAVKSLDASAKSLDASAKYFGRVSEIFWTPRRNPWTRRLNILDASAKSLDASAKYFGLVGGVSVASASQDWSSRQEICFQDVVYISLDSMSCVLTQL